MKKVMKAVAALMLMTAVAFAAGCNKQENSNVKVTTYEPQDITPTSVTIKGEVDVLVDGITVTDMGVCWGTSKNPTISDNHMSGNAKGTTFTCTITGLEPGTKYYVCVYATDGFEFYYSTDKVFTTEGNSGGGNGYSSVPEGCINGKFTINEHGTQVYFSKGNLQYQASTNTWRFAENQWDYVGTQFPSDFGDTGGTIMGSDNSNISASYSGWIDLFGWGTSGYDHGAIAYQPWSTSTRDHDYFAYGIMYNDLYSETTQADWGHNAISNGGSQENSGWRTLSGGDGNGEWYYLTCKRNTASGIRWTGGTVNGVNGIILLPDDWADTIYALRNPNGCDYSSNTITATDWVNILEANGAVFLPAAGHRTSIYVGGMGNGCYWSGTATHNGNAFRVSFNNTSFISGGGYSINSDRRINGFSVRLVRRVK